MPPKHHRAASLGRVRIQEILDTPRPMDVHSSICRMSAAYAPRHMHRCVLLGEGLAAHSLDALDRAPRGRSIRKRVKSGRSPPISFCSTTFWPSMARKLVRSAIKYAAPSIRLQTSSGARRKQAPRVPLKRTPRRNASIRKFISCRRATISSVRSKRARCRSAMISRKSAFCCSLNPKI